jgi:uncharacterized protein
METRTVIADTGFIVALLNQTDARHQDVAPIYQQHQTIWFPQTVLAEVLHFSKVFLKVDSALSP